MRFLMGLFHFPCGCHLWKVANVPADRMGPTVFQTDPDRDADVSSFTFGYVVSLASNGPKIPSLISASDVRYREKASFLPRFNPARAAVSSCPLLLLFLQH